jgi:hypothetical protein
MKTTGVGRRCRVPIHAPTPRGAGSVLDGSVQINGSARVEDGGKILGGALIGSTAGPSGRGVGSLVVSGVGSQVTGGNIALSNDVFAAENSILRVEAGGRVDAVALQDAIDARGDPGHIEVDGIGSTIEILNQAASVNLFNVDVEVANSGTFSVRGPGMALNFRTLEVIGPDSLVWGERIGFFGQAALAGGTIRADDVVEVLGTNAGLRGEGRVEGVLNAVTGFVLPEGDGTPSRPVAGRLVVDGSAFFEPASDLNLFVNGREAGEFSVLAVTGDLVLEGELNVVFSFGQFAEIFNSPPVPGDSFPVIEVAGSSTLNPTAITVIGGPPPEPPFALARRGNIVSLVVPEPATALAQAAVLTTLVGLRRSRRRSAASTRRMRSR